MSRTFRVLVAEGSSKPRRRQRRSPDGEAGVAIAGKAESMEQVPTRVCILLPDVTLLNCKLVKLAGVDLLYAIGQESLAGQMLDHGNIEDEPHILRTLQAAAGGYRLQGEAPERSAEAVRASPQGKQRSTSAATTKMTSVSRENQVPNLTKRESQVLEVLARGLSNGEIAKALTITERTVRFHLQNIYDKLGVRSRAEAVIWAVQHGPISDG